MQLMAEQKNFKNYFTQLYYQTANQTQKYWQRDNKAALKVQSKFRMFMKRKQFLCKKQAAIRIQTLFRSYNARKQFKIKKMQEDNRKNLLYFAKQAVIIQKMFRGYFIRKCVHNFYLRKQELQALSKKNDQFRKQLQQFGKAQAAQTEQYQKQQAKAQFKSLARNLHHLTSTKNIPGVYNSPFAIQKPSVFDKTVEQHLKNQFKSTYKWRAPRRQDILKHSINNNTESRKIK